MEDRSTTYAKSAPRTRVDHSTSSLTEADIAAHLAASYVRTAPGDSDPDQDEALRRARGLATVGSIR